MCHVAQFKAYGGSCIFLSLYVADFLVSAMMLPFNRDIDAYADHIAERQAFHLENVSRFRGLVETNKKPFDLTKFRCFG
jgi:hypothetical protein